VGAADVTSWTLPTAAIVISDYVAIRWLIRLDRKVDEQGERIARLEGKVNGKP
jgi:hypothetical protein